MDHLVEWTNSTTKILNYDEPFIPGNQAVENEPILSWYKLCFIHSGCFKKLLILTHELKLNKSREVRYIPDYHPKPVYWRSLVWNMVNINIIVMTGRCVDESKLAFYYSFKVFYLCFNTISKLCHNLI